MTQPENFTAAQASDPQTPGQTLADIAALRPDLRAAVASNPSTYPALLEWLKGLGDPAVDAAIAARPAAGQVTQQMPAQAQAPQTGQGQPTQAWAGQGQPTQGWSGQANQGAPAYYSSQGMPSQGMPPQGGSLMYGAPAPRGSNKKALWIILGVVGLIIVLGIVAVIYVINRAKDVVDDVRDDIDITDSTGDTYGDDAALDALWDSCADEDWEACDSLYLQSPVGSEYEEFGDTCGNRTDGTSFCTTEFGGGTEPTDTANAYGDDASLDALWDACTAEDWESCDSLYMSSPVGSEYETYGDTCGERTDGTSDCVDAMGGGTTTTEPFTYGDDASLDALWDACTGEDWQACDDLYFAGAVGSDYEAYGDTCGNKYDAGTTNLCVDVMP